MDRIAGRNDGLHQAGVGMMLSSRAKKALIEWKPITERLMYARFHTSTIKISIITVYAPTNDATDETKESFIEQLDRKYKIVTDTSRKRFEPPKLQRPEVRKAFSIELKNRFQLLDELEDIETFWEDITKCYKETATNTLGFKERGQKPWISNESWKLVDERRKLKERTNNSRSERVKNNLHAKYSDKDKEVKKTSNSASDTSEEITDKYINDILKNKQILENICGQSSCTDVSSKGSQYGKLAKQIEDYTWVQCDNVDCQKWRQIPNSVAQELSDKSQWYCYMNSDTPYNSCSKPEEDYTAYDKLAKKLGFKYVMSQLTEGVLVWAKMHGYCR
ncbi:unnamed protein product [Mytilus coruscus]|uniref:CW-type domain-containing protein n=1 Tax=Mytilus coruscus TaxID=42192 RepID=A0A6J8E6C1_MYTCO|nr:unnamed protein product [Mytilus coruscus]